MSLQKQNVPVNFQQGVDTKTDPKMVQGKMLTLENAVLTSPGQYKKRNGYGALGVSTENNRTILYNSRVPGSLSLGNYLASFNNETVLGDGLNLYSYDQASTKFTFKGSNNTCAVTSETIINTTSVAPSIFKFVDSADNGVQRIYVYSDDDDVRILVFVTDIVTGQVLLSNYQLTGLGNARCITNGGVLSVVYPSASHTFSYVTWNSATGISTPATLIASMYTANPVFDVFAANGLVYFACANLTPGVTVTTFNSSWVQGTAIAKTDTPYGTVKTGMSVIADANNAWVSYYDGNNVRLFIVNAAITSTTLAPTTIATVAGVQNITATLTSTSAAVVLFDTSYLNTEVVTVTSAGVTTNLDDFIRSCTLISKAWTLNGIPYVAMSYASNVQPIGVVGALYNVLIGNSAATIVSTFGYGRVGGNLNSGTALAAYSLSGSIVSFPYTLNSTLAGVGFARTQLDFTLANPQVNTQGQNLLVGGGQVVGYDGDTVTENNFYVYPEGATAVAVGSGGGLTAGLYGYQFVYSWTDAQGNLHQSAPSPNVSVTNIASDSNTIVIPTLRITSKQNVIINTYRTAVNGTVYYNLSPAQVAFKNDPTTDSVTFVDTIADSSIIGNLQLYTTGGEEPNIAPPPGYLLSTYKNRTILTPSETPTGLWYSKQTLPGTAPEFSLAFVQPTGSTGGAITGHRQMDGNLIIMKVDSVYAMSGEGPSPNGSNNDFTTPVRIPTSSGCRDPNSLVLTPEGLMYMSEKGIWLLNRGLTDSYIGADVEQYNSYTVTSAVLVPNTNQVRFTLSNGTALVYDYYVKQWGVFTGIAANSACILGSTYSWLGSTGIVYSEGGFADNGAFIKLRASTGWIQVAGLQGFQRVYQMLILGNYVGPHQLKVTVSYDFDPTVVQTDTITAVSGVPYQWRVFFARQKCQAIRITLEDVQSTGYNEGLSLTGLTLECGVKSGLNKLPAAKSFG